MKRWMVAVFAALLVASFSAARAQDVGALVAQMQCADAGQRTAAVDAIAQAGAPALPLLFDLLGGENPDAGVAARLAIQKIVYRASAPGGDRAAAARALADIAAWPEPVGVRAYALRMVSFVGRDEVVPDLARLLGDREVREMARWALVRIPGKAATEVLSATVDADDPAFEAALITALGVRHYVASAPDICRALGHSDEAVRLAAIGALGQIADPASEAALRLLLSKSGREGDAARTAYLRLAGALLAAGEPDRAAQMYRARYLEADSEQEKCAALGGLARASGAGAVPTLLTALRNPQAAVAGAAAAALVEVPGKDATKMIAAAVPDAAPPVRLRLIEILGHHANSAALPALFASLNPTQSVEVREAAVKALGQIGYPVAAVVARVLDAEEDSLRAAAVMVLAQMPKEATPAIVAALKGAPAPRRPGLVRILGYRRDAQAAPAVVEAIEDSDPAVRLAAIQAAGDMAAPSATPPLLDVLRTGSDDERAAAEAALGRMRTQRARRAIVAALDGAPDEMRAALLRALGRRAGPNLLPLYVAAAKDANEAVSLAGLEALGILRDEKAAPTFVESARAASSRVRAMAVHGYLLLGTGWFDRDREHALAMSRLALTLPAADEDRRAALGAIAHFRDADSLPLVTPLLQTDALRRDAVPAAMAIAESIADSDKEQAIALYRRLLGITSDRGQLNNLAGRLRKLGEDVDQARDAGFVVHWWVLGPISNHERLTKTDVIPTDAPIDLTRKVEADGRTFEWRPVRVEDVYGMVDLEEVVAHKADCGAYGYAEVMSDAARDVLVKIGSDDDVVCWLNGERIHAHWGVRGYAPDQAVVPARLRAGANSVLLKVLNRGSSWALGLRFTDPDGQPLILEQRKP